MKRLFSILALVLMPAGLGLANGSGPSITGAEWQVTEIAGIESLPLAPTFEFSDAGRFSGFAGCNRIIGGYQLEDGALVFGAIGATKMLCEEAQMQVERAVFAALERVSDLVQDGDTLRFVAGDEVLITARR